MTDVAPDSIAMLAPRSDEPKFKNDRKDPSSLVNTEQNFMKDHAAENGAVFDIKTGKPIIATSSGKDNGVDLDWKQVEKLRSLNGEALFTHNHPRNRSFSEDDFYMMLAGNIKEFRAISERYLYVLTDAEGKFRSNFDFKALQPLNGMTSPKIYALAKAALKKIDYEKSEKEIEACMAKFGTTHEQEEEIQWTHARNELLAKKFGLKYERIPINHVSL